MPHAISDVETKSHDLPGYSWVESKDSSRSMTRGISNGERMFVILNRDMYGQNCPFLGAHISLQGRDHSSKLKPFNISQLHARATKAFYQTRWKYPTVAGHLVDDDKFSYNIESGDEVGKWADRTVFTICQDEGWAALRERLSRESSLPTSDGDCCLIYLIVQPDETIKPELKSFDILMHMHHAFTDGSGIRVILNEFIERLADPSPDQEILWGKETQRLFPAAVLLEKIEEPEVVANTELAVVGGKHMNGVIPKVTPFQIYSFFCHYRLTSLYSQTLDYLSTVLKFPDGLCQSTEELCLFLTHLRIPASFPSFYKLVANMGLSLQVSSTRQC
jgi:hypothetical protein